MSDKDAAEIKHLLAMALTEIRNLKHQINIINYGGAMTEERLEQLEWQAMMANAEVPDGSWATCDAYDC